MNNPPLQDVNPFVSKVNSYAQNKDWSGLNQMLREVNIKQEPVSNTIALLRSTYPVREHLTYWNQIKLEADIYFEELELPSTLLKGL